MPLLAQDNLIKDAKDLNKIFYSGCKKKSDFKIGLESERIPVNNLNFKALSYYEKNGICDFLVEFKKRYNYNGIFDGNNLVGLSNDEHSITLEPGSQLEVALSPKKTLNEIDIELQTFYSRTNILAEEMGFSFLGYGLQPVSTFDDIDLIPKKRYEFMNSYLPTIAKLPKVMMRETAGTQCAFDYESETDAIRKLKLALKLSPILSGLFANSPVRNGKLTGFKSFRANSWLQTDEQRCGLISEKLFDKNFNFTFQNYSDILLDVPMIFIQRKNKIVDASKINFREFLENGFEGQKATKADWELHLSLYFTDVRLKHFIEVRNCDCQSNSGNIAFASVLKGILYNKNSFEQTEKLLENLNWQKLNELRKTTPKDGIKAISKLTCQIIELAQDGLDNTEKHFLNQTLEHAKKGLSPADIIIQKWQNNWNENISELIKHTRS